MGLRIIPILSNTSVRFMRADALLEKGMIVCVYCGSKYSKLIERCPIPNAPLVSMNENINLRYLREKTP